MAAISRAERLLGHLAAAPSHAPSNISANATAASKHKKSPDDVVIVSAKRTAIGKAKRGDLANTFVEDMLSTVFKACISEAKIDPALIGDVVCGSVLGQNGQRANEVRIAAFFAGIPETVPVHLVNRQCSSGLQALAHVAASIKAGYYDIGLAGGVESMSLSQQKWEGDVNPKIFEHPQARECLTPMGITSENVAARYGITRREQDELAVRSHQRAAAAIKAGKFKSEIVPMETTVTDAKTGNERKVVVDTDGGVRGDTTLESLAKLKPAFKKDGTTTAGNASQVSDGAAAVLAMRRSVAEKLGVPILGTFRSFNAAGVDPAVMGIGPVEAIPRAVALAGLTLEDIDLYEINEAFASQAAYCVKKLGLNWDNVNVNGGAIALGHPLGCTGARMVSTLLYELKRRPKARYGVISMCIGSGMGAAAVFEKE